MRTEMQRTLNRELVGSKNPAGRAAILKFERTIAKHPEAVFGDNPGMPLKHTFAPGVYVREIFIPKGSMLTGKIHRHSHPNFLMSGEVIVVTEGGGREHLKAPMSIISKAGTKRAIVALEDTVWITVHVTEETDLKKIEEYVIAPSYQAFMDDERKRLSASEFEEKNCLILALKKRGIDAKFLLPLADGLLLPFKKSLATLKDHGVCLKHIHAKRSKSGIWHIKVAAVGNLHKIKLNDTDMVGAWVAVAIGGAAVVGAGASIYAGNEASNAANNASNTQLQAMLASIQAQTDMANKGFGIFQQQSNAAINYLRQYNNQARNDLAPMRELALQNLKMVQGYTDPNSKETAAERAAYQKVLAQNLSARGLTGSGAEIAGLSDFEIGLARERRNLALGLAGAGANTLNTLASLDSNLGQNLAGVANNLGTTGASLFGNLGQNIGSSLQAGGNAQASSMLAASQAQSQGIIGAGNAFQGGLAGLGALNAQQQQNAWLMNLLHPKT